MRKLELPTDDEHNRRVLAASVYFEARGLGRILPVEQRSLVR
jgi:hypothetical protein